MDASLRQLSVAATERLVQDRIAEAVALKDASAAHMGVSAAPWTAPSFKTSVPRAPSPSASSFRRVISLASPSFSSSSPLPSTASPASSFSPFAPSIAPLPLRLPPITSLDLVYFPPSTSTTFSPFADGSSLPQPPPALYDAHTTFEHAHRLRPAAHPSRPDPYGHQQQQHLQQPMTATVSAGPAMLHPLVAQHRPRATAAARRGAANNTTRNKTVWGNEDRRQAHNVSERRRRNSIKVGFVELKGRVPLLDRDKHSKLDILRKTLVYVRELEERKQVLYNEIVDLKREIGAVRQSLIQSAHNATS